MEASHVLAFWSGIRQGLGDTIGKFSDEELDYVPFEGSFSVRQIMLHIAQEELGEIQYGLTRKLGEFPPAYEQEDYPTIALIEALLDRVHVDTIRYLEGLEDGALDSDIEAQWGERKPLFDFISHVIVHEVHHRGELSLILGLLGRQGLDA